MSGLAQESYRAGTDPDEMTSRNLNGSSAAAAGQQKSEAVHLGPDLEELPIEGDT